MQVSLRLSARRRCNTIWNSHATA